MGFFDKLFGGKAASETKFSGQKMTVMLPIDGKVIPLEQLPDETFASAILGPGCGVEPTGDTVYAPFDGTVTQVPESLHAVGMMSDDGIELLIHVGMDTVMTCRRSVLLQTAMLPLARRCSSSRNK